MEFKRRTILLVEDDPQAGRVLSRVLQELGYGVARVRTAWEAVEFYRTNRPGAILLDLSISDLSRLAVLETLRDQGVAPGCPVVVMTADPDLPTARQALELGVDEYITKPFSRDRLKEVLLHRA